MAKQIEDHEASTYTQNYMQLRSAESKRVFPREEHTNRASNTKWSTLKTYIN